MIQIIKSLENEVHGGGGGGGGLQCFFLLSFFFFHLLFSPSYSSVPAVHLITTVYSTVVRTRECVFVRDCERSNCGINS